jgi:4-hydroxyacetophenone monooxygenase
VTDLQDALADADIPILLMVLVHLTGDTVWIEEPFRPVRDSRIFADESGGLAPDVQARVRAAVAAAMAATGDPPVEAELSDDVLAAMMSACVGERVADEYVPLLLEEMGLRPRDRAAAPQSEPPDVVIVGAGLSGIGIAMELEALGIPYVVLEKNRSPGGTWFENTYPGAGVDTPNHFYSYSHSTRRAWTSYFSKQPEVLAYIDEVLDASGIRDRIRCDARVLGTRYDEGTQRWRTTFTDAGGRVDEIDSSVVVTAVGHVNRPKLPPIEGLDTFAGPLFHTARWPHGLDLKGKRVALVGTGASAMQAAPAIAESAGHLTIYQRSPQWVMPIAEYHRAVSERKQWLLDHLPHYAAWYRFTLFWRYADGLHRTLVVDADWPHPERSVNVRNERHRTELTAHLTEQLDGRPDLVEKALPRYPPYGKRMLVDNGWFAMLRRDDVELVSDALERMTAGGVVAGDTERPHDIVVMATGFETTRLIWPIEVTGRGGLRLDDFWDQDDIGAYLGMTVPGFPNLFMMLGPHAGLAHGGSAIFHVECQVRYITKCLAAMAAHGAGAIECLPERYADYEARVDAAHERLVFSHPGATNWYKNRRGRVVTPSPWRLVDYWWMTREPDLGDYRLEPVSASRPRR